MGGNGWVIDLHDVHKTYRGKIRALRGVDMRVGRGEIFGLLGPNGAGKSTLVKIMMTVVLPDRATGSVLGQPLGHKPTLQRVGYLPEGHKFPAYMTGSQVLDFYARLSRVPDGQRRQKTAYWLERLGMSKWAGTRISQYSKGMMQRVGVAQALLHDPEVVLLDEPTDGVDPIGRRDIRLILQDLKQQGKTVFLNSHLLSELEMVCDRVAILVHGQVARQGTIDELTAHTVTYQVTTSEALEPYREFIEQLGASVVGKTAVVKGDDATVANRIIDLLRERQVIIESVQPRRWSLEDVFVDAARSLGTDN